MPLVLRCILKRIVSSFLVFLHMCLLSFSFVDCFLSLPGFLFFPLSFSPFTFLNECQMCYPGTQKPCGRLVVSSFWYGVGWAMSQTAPQLQE